jgi:adenosylcobyric acid synthase
MTVPPAGPIGSAPVRGGLLVAGTASDAGKSVLVTGLCRWLNRNGVPVAPFKAMNMSNNSVVTPDGGEIGRAQAAQASACGLEPETAMNPVLVKPGGERDSHILVRGRPLATAAAMEFGQWHGRLREESLAAYDELAARYDVVISEGAGGAAEINLRHRDLANLELARARELPVILVADIDRGGVFASLFGTLALLGARDQALVSGFVINKFRGDPDLLAPGLDRLRDLTGRPVLGVLPWRRGLDLDGEDSLSRPVDLDDLGAPAHPDHVLRVAAIALPRASNATDLEALACEPGVRVTWTTSPAEVAAADLAVLPGTRATVRDLTWLRERGLDRVLRDRAERQRPVLGICGGYQMLAERIHDEVESGQGSVPGLGLLPVEVDFAPTKTVRRVTGSFHGEAVTTGYEIRHGALTLLGDGGVEPFLDGFRRAAVWGTTWHGAWESDGFRRVFLSEVAHQAGVPFRAGPVVEFARVRARRIDTLADLVVEHLDVARLERLIAGGAPPDLPFIPPGAPS